MAAATVTGRHEAVFGNYRVVFAKVTIANNGDTWNTGLKQGLAVSVDPTTNASVGATFGTGANAGLLTFASGGALVMSIIAVGYN